VTLKTWTRLEEGREGMIEIFHASRRTFRRLLLKAESRVPGTTALVAGYCQGCEACCRPEGLSCRAPSELRYSLEAVGFDVTALAEHLAGQRIQWPQEGIPDYLLTVGALLCPGGACAEELRQAMMMAWEEQQHG
jgi:predicted metal-binding protein